ncbi:hypothetical protein FRX31_019847, partial [Thalictrum thalictroides]
EYVVGLESGVKVKKKKKQAKERHTSEAGRFWEAPDYKLMVDYTGEDVIFGGANATVNHIMGDGVGFHDQFIKGEDGIVMEVVSPGSVMEKFAVEIAKLVRAPTNNSSFIVSPI